MVPGRRLVVRGTTVTGVEHAETVVLKEVVAAGTGRSQLVLEQALSTAYVRDTVVVHGNVATATHGETVQQLLGAGQARMAFQRFSLAHDPLTYRRSTDRRQRRRAELELRVNDVRWDERPTLFGAGPDDRAYVVRTDEDGATVRAVRRRRGGRAAADRARTTSARATARASARPATSRAGAARPAHRPAARRQGRQQPRAGDGRRRPGARGRRARRRSRSPSARSAVRCRCSTTRTSRAHSPASPKAQAAVLPLRGGPHDRRHRRVHGRAGRR